MMMSGGRNNRLVFTANQWQELEHQALIYKYMVSGMPVPPDLLYSIGSSMHIDSSTLSSKLLLNHQPQPHLGWNYFQMGYGKKIDPEPGRCRRTDGKKWRCSKDAYLDSKYCERHMHRGRNRSRKPVEVTTTSSTTTTTTATTTRTPTTTLPTAIPFSSITKTNSPSGGSHHHFLYPHSSSSSSSRPHDHTTNFLMDSGPYSRNGYGHHHGMKEEVDDGHVFFSEATSGTMRSSTTSVSVDDSTWQMAPLTMSSPTTLGQLKTYKTYVDHSPQFHELYSEGKNDNMHMKPEDQPKKVMHHFFDEWPQETKSSWLDDDGDKYGISHGQVYKTHLSISIPNSPHDFFMTHNEK